VLGPASLCVGLAEPAASFEGTQERYERLTAALIGACAALGIDAEQGEIAGEWCPGAWSIRSGNVKLAGLAQRAVKGGAWAEGVIELAPDPAARALLTEVYAALNLPLDMSTVGSLSELLRRRVNFDEFAQPLLSALGG
jgi:lipoate-protein ligase A